MELNYSLSQKKFLLIAGPCVIENKKQIHQIADLLIKQKLGLIRGGIYKMRTNPHSFQGLGVDAIKLITDLKKTHNLKFISEITDPRQIDILSTIVDIFQVGTRNMYNYELLKELGSQTKPVLLKRAFCGLIKEWLLAADYLVQAGNTKIILCERGIRTFESSTRNTLDLSGALVAKRQSSFPVIVDPSHSTGQSDLVIPMALATAAAGLDGLLIEVHPEPKQALSDGQQSLNFTQFTEMIKQLKQILSCTNRTIESMFFDETFFNKNKRT